MGEIRRFAIADACSVYGESLRTKPTVATSASIVRERKEMTGLITAPAGTTLCGARPPRRLQIGSRIARLSAGGTRIRTIGPAEKETAVKSGPAADHRRLGRRPEGDLTMLVESDPQLLNPYGVILPRSWSGAIRTL